MKHNGAKYFPLLATVPINESPVHSLLSRGFHAFALIEWFYQWDLKNGNVLNSQWNLWFFFSLWYNAFMMCFEQTWISFPKGISWKWSIRSRDEDCYGCFVPFLVEISKYVMENKIFNSSMYLNHVTTLYHLPLE